ncbi:hypothetical protein [Kineococcus auxinigenes]
MSVEHRWLQERLRRVCEDLGYEAHLEDSATHADVYLPSARFALEVQRWPTDVPARTAAREALGAEVVWFFTDVASGRTVHEAVREHRAVRLSVAPEGDRYCTMPVLPWEEPDLPSPQEVRLARSEARRSARLYVHGNVLVRKDDGRLTARSWYRPDGGGWCERPMRLSARTFLDEVLGGKRTWVPAGTRGLPRGLDGGAWIRREDLPAATGTSPSTSRNRWHPPQPTAPAHGLDGPPPTLSAEPASPLVELTTPPAQVDAPVANPRGRTSEPVTPSTPVLQVDVREGPRPQGVLRRVLGVLRVFQRRD